jgi:dsDNA-specific endonuclease/ATPase MutS2
MSCPAHSRVKGTHVHPSINHGRPEVSGHDPVPLTLELDRERPGVIISESNTGGKTVVLKTVGLLTTLAAGQKFIRVVHGQGTGRLKAAVRAALQGHPGIARVEDAPQNQGGAGATLVTLR